MEHAPCQIREASGEGGVSGMVSGGKVERDDGKAKVELLVYNTSPKLRPSREKSVINHFATTTKPCDKDMVVGKEGEMDLFEDIEEDPSDLLK